jgi:hypothetical protein
LAFTDAEKHLIFGLFQSVQPHLRNPREGSLALAGAMDRIQRDCPERDDLLHVQMAAQYVIHGLDQIIQAKDWNSPQEKAHVLDGRQQAQAVLDKAAQLLAAQA